ncbi:MAG TPA: sugar ABC transporter permease [Candidatus Jeotgalibaca merdavium]|uniref:Maltose/maltodextrin transport system permease protein n=1 Tax=Candidatus Jeotgalibaca merdavium TaxID=2838627 RepID=A0A9D2I0M4_9LACT|nr:sugar ABC transporter permease [Candidatus Jeotgalibaca merdavium]
MSRRYKKERKIANFFLAPSLISIVAFTIVPIAYTVYISFTNYNIYHLNDYKFVGISNYLEVFSGSLRGVFFPVLGWSLLFALLSTLGSYLIGMTLAILLNNSNMKESKVYKSILIVPWALPATIAILAWQGLLNEQYGGINNFLSIFGVGTIPWMTDAFWARFGIILVNLWLGFPYMLNVCIGGLKAIDPTFYEAAKIDGASRWDSFKYITFPTLTRLSIPLIVSTFAANFNNFGNIYMITQGGPAKVGSQFAGETDILASTIYKMTTWSNRYELSATLSVLSFVIVGSLTLLNLHFSGAFKESKR